MQKNISRFKLQFHVGKKTARGDNIDGVFHPEQVVGQKTHRVRGFLRDETRPLEAVTDVGDVFRRRLQHLLPLRGDGAVQTRVRLAQLEVKDGFVSHFVGLFRRRRDRSRSLFDEGRVPFLSSLFLFPFGF